MIYFHVITRGLSPAIEAVYSDAEWMAETDWAGWANCNLIHVCVADQAARDAWLAALRRYRGAAWTPNQDAHQRDENAKVLAEARATMVALEAAAEQEVKSQE